MKVFFRAATALLLSVLSLGLSAQAGAKPSAIPDQIRVVTLKGPTGIGMLKQLESKSLTLADGRTITLVIEVAGTPDIMDARVAARQADFVTLPVNQAARLYNLGTGLKLGGVNIWGALYLVAADGAAGTWAGLKGKRIYSTGKGATPDIVFRDLAARNGLDPERDFTLDYSYGQVELAQLMIAGKIDLACLPEPFVTRILAKKPGLKVVMDLQKEWAAKNSGGLVAQGGIAVAGDFAAAYPSVAREFLAAYAQSNLEATTATDAPQRVAALDLGIDADSYKASLPRLNLQYRDATASRPAVEAFLKAFLAFDPASIGGKLPDAGFYFK
jgi:NitT/TauT family transport system substrate-binding protein